MAEVLGNLLGNRDITPFSVKKVDEGNMEHRLPVSSLRQQEMGKLIFQGLLLQIFKIFLNRLAILKMRCYICILAILQTQIHIHTEKEIINKELCLGHNDQ